MIPALQHRTGGALFHLWEVVVGICSIPVVPCAFPPRSPSRYAPLFPAAYTGTAKSMTGPSGTTLVGLMVVWLS